jgi:hypothetical protein
VRSKAALDAFPASAVVVLPALGIEVEFDARLLDQLQADPRRWPDPEAANVHHHVADAIPERRHNRCARKKTSKPPPDRDKGKRFKITEMPAMKAEKWAARFFLALAKSGIDIPS